MARVCKRGGKIGLANWTPEGFIGQLFKTIGKHVPPQPGAKVAGALGYPGANRRAVRVAVTSVKSVQRNFVFRYRSPEHCWRFQNLLRPGAQDLRRAPTRGANSAPARSHRADRSIQPLGDGTMVVPSEYSKS